MNNSSSVETLSERHLQKNFTTPLLCEVEYVNVKDRGEWARVRPIYRQSPAGWVSIPPDLLIEDFASQGLVFWPRPQVFLERGQIVFVSSLAVNEHFGEGGKHDLYKVVHGAHALECLVCETFEEERELHGLFTNEGLAPRVRPLNKRFYVQLTNKSVVGPFPVTESQGRLRCSQPDLIARIPLIEDAANYFEELDKCDRQKRFFLKPGVSLPASTRVFNLESPETALKGVLRRIREMDSDKADTLNESLKALDGYIKSLGSDGIKDSARQVDLARARRVLFLLDTLKLEAADLTEITEALSQRSDVKQRVVQELEEFHSRQRERFAEELAAERDRANDDLQVVRDEFAREKSRLEELKREGERLGADVSLQLQSTVEEILRAPLAKLSEHAVVRGLLQGANLSKPKKEFPVGVRIDDCAVSIEGIGDGIKRLSAGLSESGIHPDVGRFLMSSILTSSVPVICGARADLVAKKLADTLCGGLMVSVSVNANTFSVVDLFGSYQAGEFVPRSLELLNLPAIAEAAPGPVLVVLEGINRAPVEVFLPSLVNATRGHSGSGIDLGFSAGVAGGKSYRWPNNIMLVGTAVTGPSVFPIPIEGSSAITLVPSILLSEVVGQPMGANDAISVSYLTRESWFRALTEVQQRGLEAAALPATLPTLPKDVHIDIAALSSHVKEFKNLGKSEADAVSWVFACRLIVLGDEDSFEDFVERAKQTNELYKKEWFVDSIRRIRGIAHRRER
jgi:hypothetical protein